MSKTRARNMTLLVTVTLCASVIGTIAAAVGRIPATESGDHFRIIHPTHDLQLHPAEHRIPTIDGATTPSLIPDDTAYRLFLRMAAHPDQAASAAFVRFIFSADGQHITGTLDDEVIRRLTEVINDHAKRLTTLDRSTAAFRDPAEFRRHQSDVMTSFRAQMARELGPDGAQRLQDVIDGRVKPKIRIFAKP